MYLFRRSLLFVLLGSCAPATPALDGGRDSAVDARGSDGPRADSSPPEASLPDAVEPVDAAAPDAVEPVDAPALDVPAPRDVAPPDVPVPDVARPDAPAVDVRPGPEAGGPRPGACSTPLPAPAEDRQSPRPKGSTCAALGYYEYVPAGYASRTDWPLLISFHGDGQRGNGTTDLASLLGTGLTQQVENRTWDERRRFVVLAPQMDDRGGMTERSAASVRAFVTFAVGNYGVDPRRVYLTGLSGGGAPIYNYLAAERGGVVAAAAIIAGWYSTQARECDWAGVVPVWYFHGSADDVVPADAHSTRSYTNLTRCTPAPIAPPRYTLFTGVGHFVWNQVYDLSARDAASYPIATSPPGNTPFDQSLYDWFLRYSR